MVCSWGLHFDGVGYVVYVFGEFLGRYLSFGDAVEAVDAGLGC